MPETRRVTNVGLSIEYKLEDIRRTTDIALVVEQVVSPNQHRVSALALQVEYYTPPSTRMITNVGLQVEYVDSSGSGSPSDSQPIYLRGVIWEYTYPDQDLSSLGIWTTETSGSPLYPSIDEHDVPIDSDYAWIDGPQVGDYFEVDLDSSEFKE